MVKRENGKYKIYASVSKLFLFTALAVIIVAMVFFIIICVKEYSFSRLDACILLGGLLLIDLYFIIRPPKEKLTLEMDRELIECYLDNGKIKKIYLDEVKEFKYNVTDAINDAIVIYKDEQKEKENIRLSGISKYRFVNIANNILKENYLESRESKENNE